ncbi:MAG: helix-turn-helix transcriptional regulator [Rhodobacteraceae bacterium]|nr:helix-turn-helix transcriptional regulator [Paracoccaceae bacterium]
MTNVDFFIGRRLRQFRWLNGVSQSDLARRVCTETAQIEAYESGKIRVSAARLLQIAQAMDLPLSAFFEGMPVLPESGHAVPRQAPSTGEARMLLHFSQMSDQQQAAMQNMSQAIAEPVAQTGTALPDTGAFWRQESAT